jgi:hypothetical protein
LVSPSNGLGALKRVVSEFFQQRLDQGQRGFGARVAVVGAEQDAFGLAKGFAVKAVAGIVAVFKAASAATAWKGWSEAIRRAQ